MSEADTQPAADVPPLAKRRVFGAAFTAVAAAITIYMGVTSYHLRQEYNAMLVAEPAHFAADLSKVGLYEGPFHQSSRLAHGEAITLKLPTLASSVVPDYSILDGLKGTATIVTAEGDEIAAYDLPAQIGLGGSKPGDDLSLTMISHFPVGRYTLRINVTEPAAGLVHMEQIISARYVLCGLEVMPAALAGIFAVAAAIPTLIVGGFTLLGWKRYGWRQRAIAASTDVPAHEHA